jgi:hypothetical protein
MKPALDHVLMSMAGTLGITVLTAMPEGDYASGDVKMIALMNVLLAQEVDRAADSLLRENAQLRALFAKAAAAPLGDLCARLSEAAHSTDADARISTLEVGNAPLKSLLIELHILVETTPEDWARDINRKILAFLKVSADARMIAMPVM